MLNQFKIKKKIIKLKNQIRVKMIETGDVNGKQIDKGVVLDVKELMQKIN